jgi:thiazolinyl imide reductase
MHADELTACLRAARRAGTGFRISTHYPHVAPVRRFLAAAARLREQAPVLFVDAASPVHVLHPFVDLLGRALGGLRPWGFADPAPFPADLAGLAGGPGPLRSLYGVVAGMPVTLRVHNQLHPGDRDNHALLWHRIAIGTEAGVLTLAATHGPVLWSPRFHADRDADRRLVLDGPGTENLGMPSTSAVGPADTVPFRELVTTVWPDAVAHALRGLRESVEAGTDPLKDGQFDLTVARMWADLARRLGPPESIRPAPPRPLPVDALAPPAPAPAPPISAAPAPPGPSPARTDERPGYGPTAEFFELAAAAHTARSAPAVAAALAGADTAAGPVVEIGAGTGLVTAAIAAALPGAAILAAEPSAPLRAVLTSRVVRDPDLRRRVTVVPEAAQELALPDRIGAAVLCGVLGHLDEAERRTLLGSLAERLAPGAPLVVELMGFDDDVAMPSTRLATAELGRQRYEWWFAAEPEPGSTGGPGALRLRSTWRVHRGDDPAREVDEDYRWFAFGLDRVAAESGLALRRIPVAGTGSAPLGVLTRQP